MPSVPETTSSDPYSHAVEVGQLMEEVRHLKAEVRRHSGNVVEAHAFALSCPRHLPRSRCCAYDQGKPCACRAAVASRWPEYAQ